MVYCPLKTSFSNIKCQPFLKVKKYDGVIKTPGFKKLLQTTQNIFQDWKQIKEQPELQHLKFKCLLITQPTQQR